MNALRGVRILLVEDEEDTREVLRVVLESEGASVTSVPSTQAALAALRDSIPDVVVSDIALPDEDGHAFLRRLRTLKPERGGGVPAVALTAHGSREERERSRRAGFHYHLDKPVDPAKLVQVVGDLVRLTGRHR